MVVNWVQAAEPDLAYFLYENNFYIWDWTRSNMNSQKYIQEFKEYIIRPVYKFLTAQFAFRTRIGLIFFIQELNWLVYKFWVKAQFTFIICILTSD